MDKFLKLLQKRKDIIPTGNDEERLTNEVYLTQSKSDELAAKKVELNQWKSRDVYE